MIKKGIKVCHLTTVHPRYDTRIFVKECSSLANAGFETHLVVADGKGDESRNNVRIHDIGKPGSRWRRIIYFASTIRKKAEALQAEIYHIHDPELLRVASKLQKKGFKVIYDAHEDVPRQMLTKAYLPGVVWKVISRLFEIYENKVASRLAGIITATPFIRDRFLHNNPNVKEVQNFPFLKEFDKTEDSLNTDKADAVCYVGSITKVRGIFPIVEALSYAEGVKLLLGGSFESEELREEVIKTKGWEHVIELGFLSREEVSATMNKSLAGLVVLQPIINYLDSIPVKMFEYMAVGIPVIASDFPYWKELLNGVNCALFVNPNNPEEIGEAIAWVKNNPKQALAMGEVGKFAVKDKFNWNTEEQKLIRFYSDILG